MGELHHWPLLANPDELICIAFYLQVHHKFDLRKETLFLTVNLIDRFLAKQSVVRKELQLIGLVAMLLACKYEEVAVPVVDDFVYISDKAYKRKEVLEMVAIYTIHSNLCSCLLLICFKANIFLSFFQEKLMLNTLQFNTSLPTAYVFMSRFLKAAQSDKKVYTHTIYHNHQITITFPREELITKHWFKQLELLSFFLIELCLVEYEMLKYPPSFVAAAAIYTAQCTLHGVAQWSKTCEWHSSYSEDQLM